MNKILIFLLMIVLYGCSKPKTVLICGDHICINKDEANQYFEEHLSLEVKILDGRQKKEIDLIELNLNSTTEENKKITLFKKKDTNEKIKVLTNDEIKNKKNELKRKKKESKKEKKVKKDLKKEKNIKNILLDKKTVNKSNNQIVDICTILEKCSIEEISNFLLKQGKEKNFPDITSKE